MRKSSYDTRVILGMRLVWRFWKSKKDAVAATGDHIDAFLRLPHRSTRNQGKFPDYEDICREVLLVEYPEEVPHESAEDFNELSWNDILDDVFASNTAKGIQMWRRLLDIAEPSLKTDAKTAEKLLPDWDWLDSPSHDQVLLLLTALNDERFVSQLFESASIGRLQYDVLNACRDCGQEKKGQHCLELALKNPYLEESWEKRLRRVFTAAPPSRSTKPRAAATAKPIADAKPDDGTVYHYCSVQVQGTRRPYAYLTGGLPLKVGDWVELPFGKDDVPRHGQVKAVMDCTRMVAPWPPEQTKTVIRTIDALVATPIIEVVAPKPKKRVEQPKKETEKVDAPAIPTPKIEMEQPKTEPQVTKPVLPEKDEKKPVPPKKPFPFKKVIAAVLVVAAISWISISVSNRNKQREQIMKQPFKSCQMATTPLPNRTSLNFPVIGMLRRCPSTANTPICTKIERTTQADRMSFQTSRCNMTRAGSRMLTHWSPASRATRRRKTPPRKPSVNELQPRTPRSGSKA